ncbi:MAG: pitrilysin family protein [Pseudomonadota bacterium]
MTQTTRLASGLTVVTEPVPGAQTVALGVFVGAATRDETPDEHGLAHFLEHMAFKGTRTRSAFDTVADIEARGGDINAETSPDTTSYTVRMLAEDWRIGLDVLLDIVCEPVFRADDIAVEQDVVVQEIAGSMDVPDDLLVDGLGLAAFPDHAMGHPILGSEASVRAIDARALTSFRARTYAPSATIISAAGAIEHQALIAALEEIDPQFPGHQPQTRATPLFAAGQFREERDSYDTHLALCWSAPAFGAEDAIPHALAIQMLGGGMTSRLFQAIREEEGLAYAVDAYQMTYGDCGLGVIQTATSADKVGAMVERLNTELARFPGSLTLDELASAKRQFRASIAMAQESIPAMAARNARHIAMLGSVKPRQDLEQEIEAVSLEEVRAVWSHHMTGTNFAKAAVGPGSALDLWLV